MKTQQDIVDRLKTDSGQMFDFFPEIAINFLTFEQAKPSLNQEKLDTEEGKELEKSWSVAPLTEEHVLAELKDYMSFAWDKAQDHRGLSASRSTSKMEAWCWLLDREKEIDWDNHENYGAPILKQICELFDIALPEYQGVLNMAEGKRCMPDCSMGCGA